MTLTVRGGGLLLSETGPVKLIHCHGLGNQFLVAFIDEVPTDGAERAQDLCTPLNGIGVDGLIFGTPTIPGQSERLTFTLFNSDGSSAEVSGNGLACFGHAILRTMQQNEGLDVVVDTAAGPRRIRVFGSAADAEVSVAVEMGTATDGPDFSGLSVEVGGPEVGRVASVDMGNPHLVVEVDDPGGVDLAVVGPALEAHFEPIGCNIHMVSVLDDSTLHLRTWERGAGATKACGSGACAVAASAQEWGAVGDEVEVRMPGGITNVSLGDPIVLSVTSTYVGDREVADG
ncbi:MAG: diaminopimelate epimerase [Acidimicrobiales bacterium]|jgi:diaminopimelate epimerase|nr:diaminopimelate epimerase [Acidimicrobiales bacterium]HJO78971.1 diaminopimelate epimerase [Acidimicrobiales bacterium]|tara:strand:- start:114 stop:974 length:861 start_codon:yes stop_codon:yes gene_type:complete